MALIALLGFIAVFADCKNAFQQSPPPTVQCYLDIDKSYRSWYKHRFGKDVDPKTHVIPLMKALQGHPEAAALWEEKINGVMSTLELKHTTHERSLYSGVFEGQKVLVCRQVDDFAVATENKATADKIISLINEQVTTENLGIAPTFDGADVLQARDYVEVSCESYLNRLLKAHGWETPGPKETDRHDIVPVRPDSVDSIQRIEGPLVGTPEHADLEKRMGFKYRQVLGEVIYAYTVCWLDIGYAVTLLSKYATKPAELHYKSLKHLCKYLRATKHWGIMYWRDKPREDLPHVPFEILTLDESLPPFPTDLHSCLAAFLDASHATDLATRRSVGAYNLTFASGAVAYQSKLQPTVATSSTEAEFIQAVHGGKAVKYLRSILAELGFPQLKPTPMFEDNQAAIAMIQENKPTERSRHIAIQHFAIQEWRAAQELEMRYIPGIINSADGGTKALGWTLQSRHARRSMGHYGKL